MRPSEGVSPRNPNPKEEILKSMKRSFTPQIRRIEQEERKFSEKTGNDSSLRNRPTRDIDRSVSPPPFRETQRKSVSFLEKEGSAWSKMDDVSNSNNKALYYMKRAHEGKANEELPAQTEFKRLFFEKSHQEKTQPFGSLRSFEPGRDYWDDGCEFGSNEWNNPHVSGIIGRFDDFITKLKEDKNDYMQKALMENPKKSKEDSGNAGFQPLLSVISSILPQGKENQSIIELKEEVYFQKQTIKELKKELENKELEMRNAELKLQEKDEYIRKLYNQRNLLADVTGIDKGSGDDLTLHALAQLRLNSEGSGETGFGFQNQKNVNLNYFLQENFVLKKYNNELKMIIEELKTDEKTHLLSQKYDILSEEANELRKANGKTKEENEGLKNQINKLRNTLSETESELQKAKLATKNNSIIQNNFVQRQIEKQEETSKQGDDATERSARELDRLQEQFKIERMEYKRRLFEMQARVNSLQALHQSRADEGLDGHSKLENKVKELATANDKVLRLAREKQELEGKLKMTRKELQKEKDALDQAKKNEKRILEAVQKLTKTSEAMKKEIETSRRFKIESDQAKREMLRMENERENFKMVLEEKETKIMKLIQELGSVETERETFKTRDLIMNEQNKELKDHVRSLTDKINELQKSEHELKMKIKEMEQMLLTSQSQQARAKRGGQIN